MAALAAIGKPEVDPTTVQGDCNPQ
jgi:hypothetical protein